SLVIRAQHATFTIAAIDGIPTLMMDPDAGGPQAAQPLAEGIEDMQIALDERARRQLEPIQTACPRGPRGRRDDGSVSAARAQYDRRGPQHVAITMTKRNSQRGSAMLVTMIVIASLLAGAAVLVSMQLASNRSSDLTRTGVSATYCAEAGLDAARSVVAANFAMWGSALWACGSGPYPCAEPSWISSALGTQNL